MDVRKELKLVRDAVHGFENTQIQIWRQLQTDIHSYFDNSFYRFRDIDDNISRFDSRYDKLNRKIKKVLDLLSVLVEKVNAQWSDTVELKTSSQDIIMDGTYGVSHSDDSTRHRSDHTETGSRQKSQSFPAENDEKIENIENTSHINIRNSNNSSDRNSGKGRTKHKPKSDHLSEFKFSTDRATPFDKKLPFYNNSNDSHTQFEGNSNDLNDVNRNTVQKTKTIAKDFPENLDQIRTVNEISENVRLPKNLNEDNSPLEMSEDLNSYSIHRKNTFNISEKTVPKTDNFLENLNKDEPKDEISKTLEVSESLYDSSSIIDDNVTDKDDRHGHLTQIIQKPTTTHLSNTSYRGTDQHTMDSQSSNYAEINPRERATKNDFGYKQSRSDMENDNRIAFHCGLDPYRGDLSNVPSPERRQEKPTTSNFSHKINKSFRDEWSWQDSVDNDQPRTIKEWTKLSEQTRMHASLKVQSGTVKRGQQGHDAILVLDCSERMRGSKFEALKATALEFVNGIQEVQRTRRLEDNIGLAVFGGQTRLIQESTSDYDLIKCLIGDLTPQGDGPLVGGLLMGLAGVLSGGISRIMENDANGHMIILTDGTSGDGNKTQREQPAYLMGDVRGDAEFHGVINLIASHSIRIFYVPIGDNKNNSVLEKAVAETNGRIINPMEIYRLIRMTQVLVLAARVAAELRLTTTKCNREVVQRKIMEMTNNSNDANEDCIDMVLDFVNPLTNDLRKGMYQELRRCRTLQLGDRVRRGHLWMHENQDSDMPGTVVGQNSDGMIWVEWDNGHRNVYMYKEPDFLTVQKVNEPRLVFADPVDVGCRVIRGPHWIYADYDGGPGCLGTVLNLSPDGTAVVRWDCKRIGVYKVGQEGIFEVCYQYDNTNQDTILNFDDGRLMDKLTTPQEFNQNIFGRDIKETTLSNDDASDVWEYKDNNTTWKKYPPEINRRIVKGYHLMKTDAKNINRLIKMDNSTYKVDYINMVQKNVGTKEEVPIRRGVEPKDDKL